MVFGWNAFLKQLGDQGDGGQVVSGGGMGGIWHRHTEADDQIMI